MLENKNHKKISLSGKSLLMGTLSTAAIVLSASTANAATTNADNVNENQTVEVTATSVNNENNKQVTEKIVQIKVLVMWLKMLTPRNQTKIQKLQKIILKQLLLMRQ